VDSSVTQVAGPQAGQLVASRYRLASFHRGDGNTEVWRALDESTNQWVGWESLRDVTPFRRDRCLAGARRLASVAEPSVMRVAGIHDDADGTFIVFEHLVHIPAPAEWVKASAQAPAPVPQAAAPPAMETAGIGPDATAPTVETSVAPEAATGDHGLSLLLYALRSRELSLIDQPLLEESMIEFLDLAVAEFKAVRLDPDLLPDARSFVVSLLTAGPRGLASAVGRIGTFRPHVRVGAPRMSQPKQPKPPKQPKQPKASALRMKETAVAAAKPMKLPKIKAPRAPRAASGPGLRNRWGRVLTRGLTLGVLAAVLVSLPPGILCNLGGVANNLANAAGNVAGQVSTRIGERIAAAK